MEKTNILGKEPAFPSEMDMAINNGKYASFGISKRLYIATMAMQGILSSSGILDKNSPIKDKWVVEQSYKLADVMLKQEEE